MKFTTRRVVLVAIVAALYAVLTVGVAPISYSFIQFRVSEGLKVLVLFNPWLALGIGMGTFFANMVSPFVGPWELVWMPLTDIAGGVLAWAFYRFVLRERWPALAMIVYALTTGAAVGVMLVAFDLGGFWFLAGTVAASELVILVGCTPIMVFVERTLKQRGLSLSRS